MKSSQQKQPLLISFGKEPLNVILIHFIRIAKKKKKKGMLFTTLGHSNKLLLEFV